MTEITETTETTTTMSASDYIAALSSFDAATYDEIIKTINCNRERINSENARQIADLEKEISDLKNNIAEREAALRKLKAQSPNTRTYGEIVNPDNSSEIYRTGGYTDWLKNMAKTEGVDIYNTKAMKDWVKMKKAQ